ncbi:hypothetical protein FBQ97_06065 [Acidobacteria bacterium ACD]|nr:hypothetical protein [Acidobacteria bacterium ACD]
MKGFVTVAVREVRERRNVLLAALAASILPLLAPFLPGLGRGNVAEARTIFALILSGTIGLGVALLCGGALFSSDLAERRFGFWFSRPLSAVAIWGGKVTGGLFLVLASAILALLPAAIAGGGLSTAGWAGGGLFTVLAILGISAVTFLLSNVVAVAIRARSPWLVIDLVLTPVLAASLWLATRRLLRFGVLPEPWLIVGAVFVFLPAALLVASAAQVAVGRTDARRGHGAQSLVLWLTLLAGSLGYEGWSRWYVSPEPASLDWVSGSASGSARWAVVEGSAPGRRNLTSVFLADLEGGRTLRLPAASTALLRVASDGSRAVLVEWDGIPSQSGLALVSLDLGRGGSPARTETPLSHVPFPDTMFLSSDGSRVGLVTGSSLQVLEVASGKLLGSSRLPGAADWSWTGEFVRADLVRLWPRRPAWKAQTGGTPAPPIVELDLASRRQTETGRYAEVPPERGFVVAPSPDGTVLLARSLPLGPEVLVLDARTGAVTARLSARPGASRMDSAFLADGRVVTTERLADSLALSLRSAAGETLRTVEVPGEHKTLFLGSEVRPATFAVAVTEQAEGSAPTEWGKGRLLLVDLASGEVTEGPAGYRPAFSAGWWFFRPGDGPVSPGAPVSRLLSSGDRHLALLDARTLKAAPLFGR